jgi:hypothetical protein
MEQRLIDADAFKKYLKEKFKDVKDQFQTEKMRSFAQTITNAFCRDIDEQPTVDAAPVVHGEWVECDDLESAMKGKVVCSNCKEPQQSIEISNEYIRFKNQKTRYCPNCGAIMDGKEQDHVDS